jgi:hypothetical protein
VGRDAMTVVYWANPVRQRQDDGMWAESGRTQPTKLHVSRDGEQTVCGQLVRDGAVVVAVTPDWHEHANCYNCVYRLWPDHAPPGYVRPRNGQDFPPRRECPHSPGRGMDPQFCPECTPRPARSGGPPPPRRARDEGNPAPDIIRRWHIPCPYDYERCAWCGQDVTRGELINIEYEAGVMHAACSDDPYIPRPGETPANQVQDRKAGFPMTGDSDMIGPGAHETNAQNAITGSRPGEAQVHAILALASAVNRLAAAAEAIAAAQT